MHVCKTLCHRVATRSNYMHEMSPQSNLTSTFFIWSHWQSFVEIHSYLLEISHGNISANQRPHDLINMRRSYQRSNLTYTFLQWSHWSIFRWDPFLALLAKGQKGLCDGAPSVVRPSVRPSVRPLATSPQKLPGQLQPTFARRLLPWMGRKFKLFFFVARTRWPPLLKIAEIYYCLLLWNGLTDLAEIA